MKIGVDLRPLDWGLKTGIPRMIYNIYKELVVCGSEQYIPMGLSHPYSVESIKQALADILFDDQRRQTMSAAGLKRANQFTWAKTATKIRGILLRVVGHGL